METCVQMHMYLIYLELTSVKAGIDSCVLTPLVFRAAQVFVDLASLFPQHETPETGRRERGGRKRRRTLVVPDLDVLIVMFPVFLHRTVCIHDCHFSPENAQLQLMRGVQLHSFFSAAKHGERRVIAYHVIPATEKV